MMRLIALGLGKLLLAILLVGLLAFGLIKLFLYNHALQDEKAEQFCALTTAGDNLNQVEARIKVSSADKKQTHLIKIKDYMQLMPVTFSGIFPLDRSICIIELEDGRVKTKYVDRLD